MVDFATMTAEQIQAEIEKLNDLRDKAKEEFERKSNESINVMVATTIDDLRNNHKFSYKNVRYFAKEMVRQCVDKVDTPPKEEVKK